MVKSEKQPQKANFGCVGSQKVCLKAKKEGIFSYFRASFNIYTAPIQVYIPVKGLFTYAIGRMK